MNLSSVPYVVVSSEGLESAPAGARPVTLFGADSSGSGVEEHTHTIPQIVGLDEFVLNHEQDSADYNRRIGELEGKIEALEALIEAL